MSPPPLSSDQIKYKLGRFYEFEERLRCDIIYAQERVSQIKKDIQEYNQLSRDLRQYQEHRILPAPNPPGVAVSFPCHLTLVNLDNDIYMHAEVDPITTLLVDVGLGFQAEMTIAEVIVFVPSKIAQLYQQLHSAESELRKIEGHYESVRLGVEKLVRLCV